TFTYTRAAGTILGAGTQTLSVTFTPTDTTDYTGASASVLPSVAPATLTVTAGDATRAYGVANPTCADTISGIVNGDSPSTVRGTATVSGNAVPSGTAGGQAGGLAGTEPPHLHNAAAGVFAVGADAGGVPEVRVFDATTGALKFNFLAYDAGFTGGVRVAVG